ncbi:uncharacterized protein RCC_09210 [Ramularia collo-cygni]|uniref:C6 finger domain protein n=1 Tax=Ramularia collo-cygni TaxID=112498 RepID=A0A2D3V296_9PEZI|nr:uncharacterized protein RCC_09210 [Ramularia collo-cygni]CZT23496.1 uncharacterized protein RCC_09210 [Ramularia collo-cygni]
MFELMYDDTGVGWDSHMGFGTSVILRACGPSLVRSEGALAIYRELRLFEISRAALFSHTTLLMDSEWMMHDQLCRANAGDWSLLEVAFDLFLQCVGLQQSFADFQESRGEDPETEKHDSSKGLPRDMTLTLEMNIFQLRGIHLQSEVATFISSFQNPIDLEEQTTAQSYGYAIMIYLSGIFDHGVSTSQPTGAPMLHSQEIAVYREKIVHLCDRALKQARESPVLLLVPLRIAGNRCDTTAQCQNVLGLISQVERSFAVAQAFRRELIEIWKGRGLL